jgi:hypothetical protein
MKRINAQKSGNWSDPDVWDGYIPAENDMVFCNSYTIFLDQDIKVKSISNDRTYSDVFGGNIELVKNNTIIEADLYSNYNTLITITNKSLFVIGNIFGGYSYANTPCILNNSGEISVIGSVVGGAASSCMGITNYSTETLNITGSVCNGNGEWSYGINNESGGKVFINNIETIERYIGDFCPQQTPILI